MPRPLIDIVRMGKKGELRLPRRIRSLLGLKEGDELIVTADDKRITIERRSRGLGTYLDVMSQGDNGSEEAPRERLTAAPGRRGLGRFLTR